jgi:DMSO/TMAO reductase YedYZ heme-binding membrane subunit
VTGSARRNWIVFLCFGLVTIAAAAAWLSTVELIDDNIRLVVRHSAKLAFALLILIIAARPLRQLVQKPWSARLLQNRRLIGVAFAGVMTGHLALIVFRFTYTPELTYPISGLIVGGGAYAMIYLLFITSFNGPTRALGPRRWKILHRTGLVWTGLIFGIPRPFSEISDPEYLMLGIPLLFALTIRFAAWRQSRQRDKQRSAA